jgi:hypothetical protein
VSALAASLGAGYRALRANWGLVVLVLLTNLAFALVAAVPLAFQLESELRNKGASAAMMYGFDYDWWSLWSERQGGPETALAPDLLGTGFALRNLDLLLKGWLPAGLFARGSAPVDGLILGLAALYALLQAFLTGGMLAVFRRPRGGWTVRGLAHGSGFYFGRMVRVGLLGLAAAWVLFAADAALGRFVARAAREAVDERTALALMLGQKALLLVALLLLHMVVSHARVLVVREERLSALLAALSSAALCFRRLPAALGQYALVGGAGLGLLLLFALADRSLVVTGFRTQLLALVLFEALVAGRIALRLWLLASQLELQQADAQGRRA